MLVLAAALSAIFGRQVVIAGGTADAPAPEAAQAQRKDLLGDPLPPGALARLGSTRFRVTGATQALVFGPEDRTLIAYCWGEVITWDRATGRELRRFKVKGRGRASFSPDGKLLAVPAHDEVRLWDTTSGRELKKITFPDKEFDCPETAPPSFSPDGRRLAVAAPTSVMVFDRATAALLYKVDDVELPQAMAFSPDGRRLAVSARRKPVQLHDGVTGEHVRDFKGEPFPAGADHLLFSPDSKWLALGSEDSARVVLTEVSSGKMVGGLEEGSFLSSLVFTADGRQLIRGHYGRGIELWDPVVKQKLRVLSTDRRRRSLLALSHDGKTLAAADLEGEYRQVRLWSLASRRPSPLTPDDELDVQLVAFAPDGKHILTGDPGRVSFWDAQTGGSVRHVPDCGTYQRAISPDFRSCAVGGWDRVEVWDLTTGKKTGELKYRGEDLINRAVYTPDGKGLVTVHNKQYLEGNSGETRGKNGVHVWDLAAGKPRFSIAAEKDCFFISLIVTPDGNMAVTGTSKGRASKHGIGAEPSSPEGGPIHVWDLRGRRAALILEGHTAAVQQLSVSDDGRWLASGSNDRTVRLWELASGKTVFTFQQEDRYLCAMALSPGGRLLATAHASGDKPCEIILWDLASGKAVYRFGGHPTDASVLAFSPDGRRLASALGDGTVLVWDLTPALRATERQPKGLRPKDGPKLWENLASLDAPCAHQAAWTLIDAQDEAVALLRKHLRPARADREKIEQLISDLDSPRPAARETATRELGQLGDVAEPSVRAALKAGPSPEAQRRLQGLLEYRRLYVNPEALRPLRSVEVLERIGTAQARELLRTLASGDPTARLTREAAAAVKR
jgi:WD40 repeat protein